MKFSSPKHDHRRMALISKIHIGKKQLGMDEETYRAMLLTLGGVKSCKDLTTAGFEKVIRHMEKAGAVFTKPNKSAKNFTTAKKQPHNLDSDSSRAAKLGKIEALLAEAKRPWAYAEAMALRMYKKQAIEFCGHEELTGIIAGLMKNAKREGRRVG